MIIHNSNDDYKYSAKNLLKDTEYKDEFDGINKSNVIPTFNTTRRAGPYEINVPLEKENI
jgi:hypothetical protein